MEKTIQAWSFELALLPFIDPQNAMVRTFSTKERQGKGKRD